MRLSSDVEGIFYEAQTLLSELCSNGVDVANEDPQLLWLERQLANLVSSLQALLDDLAAGCSPSEMGFFGNEFEDMLDDLRAEIANLKSMLQSRKMVRLAL